MNTYHTMNENTWNWLIWLKWNSKKLSKKLPCICVQYPTVPHTFAEQTSELRVFQTKKKSESKPALFVFIKNPQHVCLVFYTLFCALRVSDYKGIINMSFKHVVQNWWFSFKRILFCIQVSHYENTTARFCIGFEPFVPDVQLQISNLSISERNRWKY